MADISMCQNKICSLNRNCYRFKAKADDIHQSYSIFIPEKDKEGNDKCENYIEMENPTMQIFHLKNNCGKGGKNNV